MNPKNQNRATQRSALVTPRKLTAAHYPAEE